jgi:hypothetical protein
MKQKILSEQIFYVIVAKLIHTKILQMLSRSKIKSHFFLCRIKWFLHKTKEIDGPRLPETLLQNIYVIVAKNDFITADLAREKKKLR